MKKTYRLCLLMLLFVLCSIVSIELWEMADNYDEKNEIVLSGSRLNIQQTYPASGEVDVSSFDSSIELDENENEKTHMVIPSGEPIGIYVKTEGVMVIDATDIKKSDGEKISPCKGLLFPGDYIVEINNEKIADKNKLISVIENSKGKELDMKVIRDGEIICVAAQPVRSRGKYMLGLWVKDDISGIGTMTYIDENGFAALGHSINDNDTGTVISVSDGAIYETELINIVKSDGEKPGRLEGIIDYSKENIIGRVIKNHNYGINGYMTKHGVDSLGGGEWIPVAKKQEAKIGEAYILSCVSGEPVYYRIEITNVDISSSAVNKGLEIKITDEKLLDITNGIVQGMSGTPIIQDGKLLGAITHVFVKDSTKGYGTFVEDMSVN